MKKTIIAVFIVLSLCFFTFADSYKVCIYPDNQELSSSIKEYFNVDIVRFNSNINNELLLTGDDRLMEYICNSSKADLLLIPIIEAISDYSYLRLYSFEKETRLFALEYETINMNNQLFGFDVIESLYNHFLENENSLAEKIVQNESFEKEFNTKSLLLDCSNVIADIYLNDQYLGKTPYVLEEYYAPSVIRFCAEGFADKIYSLSNTKQTEIKVSLISNLKSDAALFSKSQNKYFISFASTILCWGSNIVVSAMNINNAGLRNALHYTTLGLGVSSTAFLGYNIFKYFKTTQTTSH